MSNAFALLGADSDADSDSDEEAVFVGGQHQRALPMPSAVDTKNQNKRRASSD